jgi:hypothetical protein
LPMAGEFRKLGSFGPMPCQRAGLPRACGPFVMGKHARQGHHGTFRDSAIIDILIKHICSNMIDIL